MKFTLK